MLPETEALYERLKASDWTAHVGEVDGNARCVPLSTAMEMAASEQCESIYLHERNLLAADIPYERYQGWGDIIFDDRRQEIIDLVNAHLPPEGPLGKVPHGAKTSLTWLIAHAIIESEFADAHNRRFFRDAVEWLIRGHIICGWAGDWWPRGKAVIY